MNKTKEQLQQELRELEEKEQEEKEKKQRQENYKAFLERTEDWVIGKAHADIKVSKDDYGWNRRGYSIGDAISIHGNCGTRYNALADITSATHTYFHNVWDYSQQANFQKKLNEVALKEIKKIMGSLRCVLEIMGLQSTTYFKQELYPKDKITEIEEVIEKEQFNMLDKYKDKDFLALMRGRTYSVKGTNEVRQDRSVDISHGRNILFRYIKAKRPKLHKAFSEVNGYINF